MKFLIQKINNEVTLDFCFELLRALEYQKWRGVDMDHSFAALEDPMEPGFIPVGTIEFVHEYLRKAYGFTEEIKPINVPSCLIKENQDEWDYIGFMVKGTREVLKSHGIFVGDQNRRYYLKSMARLKDPINGLYTVAQLRDLIKDDGTVYQVRKEYDILSEWRGFVYQDELLAVQPYSGDPLVFPDGNRIKNLLSHYRALSGFRLPPAFTIDFAITAQMEGTILMEVHEFFSCGLYGFSDYTKLPWMFIRTWQDIMRRYGLADS